MVSGIPSFDLRSLFQPTPLPRPAEKPAAEAGRAQAAPQFSASSMSLSIQIHVERTVLDSAGNALRREESDAKIDYRRDELRFAGVEALLDHFSPENTANRIADFVTKGFGRTSFGEKNDKGSFVDFILPYIRQGVDSALAAFGQNLPDDVKAGAEDTFSRVQGMLREFAGV